MTNTYIDLNAQLNLYDGEGRMQLHKDKEAARAYFIEHVNKYTQFFHDLEEKVEFLVENNYWDKKTLDQYDFTFIKKLFKQAYAHKYRFKTFLGAYKFYNMYALRSDDGETIFERFEDRVCLTALHLAQGVEDVAVSLVEEMITGRYQPATPTFQNAGKARGGEQVSCFLIHASDSLDSIQDTWSASAQLSKIGGGVAINLTNLRESGAPLKGKSGLAKGIVNWMKVYEDIFSTVDQLGTRPGAGAVYLSVHHPDIELFLDSKKENADEKIRIKTLSTGVVIPDVFVELARSGDDYYTFSPYDVLRETGETLSNIDITARYGELVNNPRIRKTRLNPRKLLQNIAETQAESGYPFILYSDTANRANPIHGRINMSNLCSEILQVNEPTVYDDETGRVLETGMDISCNLGSVNVVHMMNSSSDFGASVETMMRALTAVSDLTSIDRVPTIKKANDEMHSVGLGQMSLASYFAMNKMMYGDDDSLDFTNVYFGLMNYYTLLASHKIAVERGGSFKGFEKSKYADGSYFDEFINNPALPQSPNVAKLFSDRGVRIPSSEDWVRLRDKVMQGGLWHSYRQAVAPTGSISYVNGASASIHPVTSPIEIRKERLGRVYYPQPGFTEELLPYFVNAYDLGYEALINVHAVASRHVDQGISTTLFLPENATTRDYNKAQMFAWRKGLKTLYYVRVKMTQLDGTQDDGCVSCAL